MYYWIFFLVCLTYLVQLGRNIFWNYIIMKIWNLYFSFPFILKQFKCLHIYEWFIQQICWKFFQNSKALFIVGFVNLTKNFFPQDFYYCDFFQTGRTIILRTMWCSYVFTFSLCFTIIRYDAYCFRSRITCYSWKVRYLNNIFIFIKISIHPKINCFV